MNLVWILVLVLLRVGSVLLYADRIVSFDE